MTGEAMPVPSHSDDNLSRLRRLLSGGDLDVGRWERLTEAIRYNPDAAANYVLRGELYLSAGDYALAAEDFETALALATNRFDEADWGLLSQAMRDQAERGLEVAHRKLTTK